jgi:glycosyl transferase family 25
MSIKIIITICIFIILVGVLLYYSLIKTTKQPFKNIWKIPTKNNKNPGTLILQMIKELTSILKEKNIYVIPMYGTLLGMVRHKGFIPWDDDVDVCIAEEHMSTLISLKDKLAEKNIGLSTPNNYIKLYSLIEPKIPGYDWSWPFIDVFSYTVKDDSVYISEVGFEITKWKYKENKIKHSDFFPLKSNLFEKITMNMPNNIDNVLEKLYGKDWENVCVSSSWTHREEKLLSKVYKTSCKNILQTPLIEDIFENVWVINLESRPDRWKRSQERLNVMGITPKRCIAVDAKNTNFQRFWEKLPNPKLSAGEVACYKSHRGLWEHINDTEVPYALIFEDDLVVSPGITKKDIIDAIKNSEGFDIIFLGHCGGGEFGLGEKQFSSPETLSGTAQCLHAYVISREAIKKLLELPEDFSVAIDELTQNFCSNNLCYLSRHVDGNNSFGSGIIHQDNDLDSNISNKGLVFM